MSEKLPPWKDDELPSPQNPSDRAAYGELLDRYADVPPALRQKLIRSELTGRAFELRLSDVIPKDVLRFQVTGALYDELQTELEKKPDYTSLDFMRVLLRSRNLPMSTRFEVAKEMLPYEHERNPAPPLEPGAHCATLVLPGVLTVEDWEREAEKHRERVKGMKREE